MKSKLSELLRLLADICDSPHCTLTDEDIRPFYASLLTFTKAKIDVKTITYLTGKKESNVRGWLFRNVLRKYQDKKVRYEIDDIKDLLK